MNIVYVSSGCSEEKFEELRCSGVTKKLPQAQKYHQLMVEGLAKSIDGNVDVVCAIPTNRTWSKKWFFLAEHEKCGNICYHYIPFINVPFLGQISKFFSAKKLIKNICKHNSDVAIICDVLNQSIADAARTTARKFRKPLLGIVTDVPGHTSGARRKSYNFIKRTLANFAEHRAEKKLNCYPAYLFLTNAMNDVVNHGQNPYIVIEGQCDHKLKEEPSVVKTVPHVAMYAGGIHKEFGIERMVKAFLKSNQKDWELHIYGDGNYQSDLKKVAEQNPSVKYFGVVGNQEIKKRQLEASLLLNPRLTDADYVKYSFPSKTMECMASGTPLLTTRLPGMPTEYYPYVYFFDDESEEGMSKAFCQVFAKSSEELEKKGNSAKHFVLDEKNNIVQAQKVVKFIENLAHSGGST